MKYRLEQDGIWRPDIAVSHRNEEYPESGFQTLLAMQNSHFWYRGRHRFILNALKKQKIKPGARFIDLGGGVGGWVKYLTASKQFKPGQIALGDSSNIALHGARGVLPKEVDIYQVDLMNLGWKSQWDVITLLDVIEHCPDDAEILRQAKEALRPGGILVISTPALKCFWSYNDEHACHLRRYNTSDYKKLAVTVGMNLLDVRYFMFLLSPLYWLSRKMQPIDLTSEQREKIVQDAHKIPPTPLNAALTAVFCAETPLGNWIKFPWGTSILAIFRRDN